MVLGTLGGIGLIVGPLGLLFAKSSRDPALMDTSRSGMEKAFIIMLLATAVSGFAVLCLRATPMLGVTLALHLGIVMALFVTMPYGKFVHGFHRYAALVRYVAELRDLQDHQKVA